MLDENCADCTHCDGEGVVQVERECPCCYGSGDHEVKTKCGALAHAPCERCEWSGYIEVEGDCPHCNGSGNDHDYQKVGEQGTFDGKELAVEVCTECNDKRFVE